MLRQIFLSPRALPLPRSQAWATSLLQQQRHAHTFEKLPDKWHKLTVPTLEVMDTSELRSLVELTNQERERVTELRTVAKAQQRKVLRVNCDLDLKRIDRLQTWIETVLKDSRRQW